MILTKEVLHFRFDYVKIWDNIFLGEGIFPVKKINRTVLKETAYIAVFVIILSMLMQSVFLIIGKWNLTVLFGNLLGAAAAVFNFFLLGLTVQKAVMQDEKKAALTMKVSQGSRMLMLFVIAIVAYCINKFAFPIFNIIAVVIPYIFPRIAIALLPVFRKSK